jgi:hypothetical protein
MAFTSAEHGVWWLVLGLGVGILVLGLLSTGRWALDTAGRAAALFAAIRRDARAGMSFREIERTHHVGWRTVRDALDSAWPKPRAEYP